MKQNKVVLNHYDYMVSKTEEIKGSICQRLKNIRKYFGFNQAEFAEYLGITQAAYSMIENGYRPLSDKYIRVICIIFSVSEQYLLSGEGEMFVTSPHEKELLLFYGKLVPENQKYLLMIARELFKTQKKLLQ
ncbi:Predicted transcriptional regulator [uncultured Clostridium sp.]|uniref:HTH cro/C1-type domain-containing protein n=1 Tax=[Clostridium] citroniae WAL-17108 TaxID=742733 RepID=G5HTL5_9FIRM|nr:helix-turn-helix transcriptional regulator [Enterocloster citroniae]EHE95178.1 hypothetical protein HMPREF9469_05927 [ [[Clostridium] citroniae WAL-17108]SCH01958.1 Predicted transcriptional regulator [uncultured Clostridium sp.]